MQQRISKRLLALLRKKNPRVFGARVGDPRKIAQSLMAGAKVPTYRAKVEMSEKKLKKRSESELLTVVSKMAYDLRHEDQMALSAAFMVAAKTIYINQLGMEQTQDLFQAMADSMDAFEVEKVTVH